MFHNLPFANPAALNKKQLGGNSPAHAKLCRTQVLFDARFSRNKVKLLGAALQ
jgi:hypothetical protein